MLSNRFSEYRASVSRTDESWHKVKQLSGWGEIQLRQPSNQAIGLQSEGDFRREGHVNPEPTTQARMIILWLLQDGSYHIRTFDIEWIAIGSVIILDGDTWGTFTFCQ